MKPAVRVAILSQPGPCEDAALDLTQSLGALMNVGHIDCNDYVELGWSECSATVAKRLMKRKEFIVVGVQVARVLRKMLKSRPVYAPCDVLIVACSTHVAEQHERLNKANKTVLAGILPKLKKLKVHVIYL